MLGLMARLYRAIREDRQRLPHTVTRARSLSVGLDPVDHLAD